MRTIAIGDIHGCVKALQGLVDALQPQPTDQLIFLGDYVDRGPDSRGVIDLLIELQNRCSTIFLLGNHEIMFRGALAGFPVDPWLCAGGRQTVTSYGGLLSNVPSRHVEFLHSCIPYFESPQHLYVHANYLHELPLSDQPEQTLFWEHLTTRVPQPHYSGKHVFLGHTPQPGGRVGYYQYFTCIDTCCFGGFWLTAIDVHSGEVWQVSREGHLRQQWEFFKKIWAKLRKTRG